MGEKTKLIQKAFVEGRKDFNEIALETGASLATVKTQWYKWVKQTKQV